MKRLLLSAIAAGTLATGCYTQGDVGVGYSYGYAAPAPDLYYLGPGVSVVAYADYPTFYADNYYWMFNNGLWYRSSYWGGGWNVWYDVPWSVRGIQRPHSYARFQPGQGWTRVGGGRGYSGGVRDHRRGNTWQAPGNPPPRGGGWAPPGQTPTRDHRAGGGGGYNPPPPRQAPPRGGTYNPPPPRGNAGPTYAPPAPRPNVDRGGPTTRPSPAARDHRGRGR